MESLKQNVANWIAAQKQREKPWYGTEHIPQKEQATPLTRKQLFENKLRDASKTSMFNEGYDDPFAAVDQQDLKLEYPKLYEDARLKNIDANNNLQERIAFDMDRFREADPWTQAGMKQLEYISGVPMGFEEQEMIAPNGGSARGMAVKGEFKRPRVYAYGGKLDPYTLAHEGRHSAIKGVDGGLWGKAQFDLGGGMEESSNRLVDYNLAQRWGDIDKEIETGRFLENMQKQGQPISQIATMQYQKAFGDSKAFSGQTPGDYQLTHESLDKKTPEEMYQLYRQASQYHNPALEMDNEFGVYTEPEGAPRLLKTGMKNPKGITEQLQDWWNK